MKENAEVDVEKRLLADAASFTQGAASLDEEGFVSRTLAALGITKDTVTNNSITPEAGRTQRPAPRAGVSRLGPASTEASAPAEDTGSLVEDTTIRHK